MSPIGLDPSSIHYDFAPAPPQSGPYEDSVPEKEARLRAHPLGAEWISEYYGNYERPGDSFTWKGYGHHVPTDVLRAVFSWEECVRIWAAQVIVSDIGEHIEEEHLEKCRHTSFHFTRWSAMDYNTIACGVEALKRLAWPGFDVRLGYVSKWGDCGWAEYPKGENIWIDNDFGLFLHHHGRHVLTVGFGFGAGGAYVSQVQLRQKRGNRFLYKMRRHYHDEGVQAAIRARATASRLDAADRVG